MNHKEVLAVLIVGFMLIFVGSLLGAISTLHASHAFLEYRRNNIDQDDLYNANDLAYTLNFVDHILQIVGGVVLSVFSAVGAFIVEDKYATLGLLVFSAIVTVFVLATILLRTGYLPTYIP